MSIKLLVEAIDVARTNNTNLSISVESRLNGMIGEVIQAQNNLTNALEDLKRFMCSEFKDRDDDLVRLMEGAS